MAEVNDATANKQLGLEKKKRRRYHSFSSLRTLSTHTGQQQSTKSQLDSGHVTNTVSTLARMHHRSSDYDETSTLKSNKVKTSIFKRFKTWQTKNRLDPTVQASEDNEKPMLLKNMNNYIRVVTSELHPRVQYKTLPITEYTTAYEVVVKIVTKFATKEEDRDPDNFYLTEEQESEQGNYSRILENNDRLHAIQSRWTDTSKSYSFVLCRKHHPLLEDSFTSHITAMVLSPSQDSFYNCLPGMITVEGGASPASKMEHQMNKYFQPSLLPVKQRQGVNVQSGLTTTRIGVEKGSMNSHVLDEVVEMQYSSGSAEDDRQHTMLPVSPSELSSNNEVGTVQISPPRESHTSVHRAMNVGEETTKLSTDDLIIASDQSSSSHIQQNQQWHQTSNGGGDNKSGRYSTVGDRDDKSVNYKKLMQQSISQGMPGIMNQVVKERKCTVPTTTTSTPDSTSRAETRRGSVPISAGEQTFRSSPAQLKPIFYSPAGMGQRRGKGVKGESMVLRTLVCSPMETATRQFPEFVFTPGPSTESRTIGDKSTESKNSEEDLTKGSQMASGKESTSSMTVNENEGLSRHSKVQHNTPVDVAKDDINSGSIARNLECDFSDNETKVERLMLQSKERSLCHSENQCLNGKETTTYITKAQSHYRVSSRSILTVTFETDLTIPFQYHSRASLYTSFLRSAGYSTEMDIMDSLHTLLNIKFKHNDDNHPTHRSTKENCHVQTQCLFTSTPKGASATSSQRIATPSSTKYLIREARKSHLLCSSDNYDATKKVNTSLKRPSSFHFQRTRSDESSESMCSFSSLDSPTRRELLMRRAAEAVRQREVRNRSKDHSFNEDVMQLPRAGRQKTTQHQGKDTWNVVKSMENLTVNTTSSTLASRSHTQLSSSNSSLQVLPGRQVSHHTRGARRSLTFTEQNKHHTRAPKRVSSFHESSKSSQSLEALCVRSPIQIEDGDEELLYTLQRRRPVTLLVRCSSSLVVSQDQGEERNQSIRPDDLSSNLTTVRSVSSQGIVEAVQESRHATCYEGATSSRSKKRFRPTSAPTSRSSDSNRLYGLDGLMTSIHLKANKLWWNEL